MRWKRPGPFKGEWERKHSQPYAAVPVYKRDKEMTLKARNEFHSGTARFERKDGYWRCYQWSECLAFLEGKDMPDAKMDLIRRGFTFEWT